RHTSVHLVFVGRAGMPRLCVRFLAPASSGLAIQFRVSWLVDPVVLSVPSRLTLPWLLAAP
ncbi:MAG: hypothetical protein EBS30_04425, partial [Planctomycetes bacterium]|nr:hypothetical protein [Planctomycetota bacterium]